MSPTKVGKSAKRKTRHSKESGRKRGAKSFAELLQEVGRLARKNLKCLLVWGVVGYYCPQEVAF